MWMRDKLRVERWEMRDERWEIRDVNVNVNKRWEMRDERCECGYNIDYWLLIIDYIFLLVTGSTDDW